MGKRAKNNTSGHTGVHWDKHNKKWIASLVVWGVYLNLGQYDLIQKAADARSAGIKKFGRDDYNYSL